MEQLCVNIEKKLKNFKLQIDLLVPGNILGILGASGCGKSMTLKAIAGIETPDRGRITAGERVFFDSEEHIDLKPQRRKVGYLFQDYALFPNMTLYENIAAGIQGKHAQKKERVEEFLRQFHLEELKEQYPGQVSGGQQQRAALARILASDPDILLLDEPFSAMDSYLKEELQLELKERLAQYKGTTIIVSHDRDEIYRLCPYMMILAEGRNLICKETKQLFAEPEYMEAARLTGCKNISKAKQVGEHEVQAEDWGVRFYISRQIPEKIKYIGVRAHDFIPVSPQGQAGRNEIDVCKASIADAPFEQNILFCNAADKKGTMWMKQTEKNGQIPGRVRVEEEKLLLLK